MTQQLIDKYFMEKAFLVALHSPDMSTQNGAVLVPNVAMITLRLADEISENVYNNCVQACNEFPTRIAYTDERWERPIKYSYVEHSERNVIYKAAFHGVPTYCATMYYTWLACADCARAIIQAGIKEVVGRSSTNDETHERWMESCKIGLDMLREAGVVIRFYNGPIEGCSPLRRDGKLLTP